VISEGQTT